MLVLLNERFIGDLIYPFHLFVQKTIIAAVEKLLNCIQNYQLFELQLTIFFEFALSSFVPGCSIIGWHFPLDKSLSC